MPQAGPAPAWDSPLRGRPLPTSTAMTKVSVGFPVYNGERYLARALASVQNQTWDDLEIVISDNGSTDRTEEICREVARADSRVRYVRNETNRGAAWNYNRVFSLATGVYFKWMPHDDLCAENLIARCVEVLESHEDVVLAYGKTVLIDEAGAVEAEYPDELNLLAPRASSRYRAFHWRHRAKGLCNPIVGVLRSNVLALTPLIGGYIASDFVLLGELALRGKIMEVPEAIFYRRLPTPSSRPTGAEESTWYDPANATRRLLPRWRQLRELRRSIARVGLAPSERAICYAALAGWAWREHRSLARDLLDAAHHDAQSPAGGTNCR